jgi:hypothetical protein
MLLYFEPTLRCNSLATEQRNDHQLVRFWKTVQPLIDHGEISARFSGHQHQLTSSHVGYVIEEAVTSSLISPLESRDLRSCVLRNTRPVRVHRWSGQGARQANCSNPLAVDHEPRSETTAWTTAFIFEHRRNGTTDTVISFSASATGRSPLAVFWQLRRSGRLKVIVAIGPSCSTRKFSAIDVALLRADAPMQLAHPPSGLRANHRC